jgi:hypothetical protein
MESLRRFERKDDCEYDDRTKGSCFNELFFKDIRFGLMIQ